MRASLPVIIHRSALITPRLVTVRLSRARRSPGACVCFETGRARVRASREVRAKPRGPKWNVICQPSVDLGVHLYLKSFKNEWGVMNILSSIFTDDLAIDLGTVNTLIFAPERGVVLNEPSAVAIHKYTGEVLEVGVEAHKM